MQCMHGQSASACAGVYMKGSMNMSYDSANLTTPDIKWLGVRPSDLNRFHIPKQCRIKMTDEDMKTGKKMVLPRPAVWLSTNCAPSLWLCLP
jgi:DNA topoisomerase VI subunit A